MSDALEMPEGFMNGLVKPRSGARGEDQRHILAAIEPVFAAVAAEYAIDTPLRLAHFAAQIAHESDGFATTEEYASGAAYEGRPDLGNTQAGDGPRFKGRGLLQLTGRANYARMSRMLGIDLIANPRAAMDPVLSLRIACIYWRDRRCNDAADADDIEAVTRKVNGGLNGLADRTAYFRKAMDLLGYEQTNG